MQCGFGILRVESAKAVQNLGIFRGKCEMLTEPGIFCGENTKCRAGISIFCPERTKIRSGFAILSLAAAKSLYHAFQAAAVPRFTEQDVLANPRTAQTARTAHVVWFVRPTASFTVSFENSPAHITVLAL